MTDNKQIRVRFAPSPTGPLHIGGVRTALYNYLFAKKNNGKFILRIEDTDQTRFVKGAEEYIIKSLNWCGITFDEGVHIGGEFGPYRQSERKEIYKKYADKLIEAKEAYFAFDTPDELQAMREKLKAENSPYQQYCFANRMNMKNSLTLSEIEVKEKIQSGEQYVIRFKMPEDKEIKLNDIVREEVIFNTSTLDDKILFKSDGMPTYHLANVVDDYLMKISHVVRGEEWLPSLPLHYLLYHAFDWEKQMPQFAHMPLTLKPDGKGKLSKRDGDRLGFPVFPLQWTDPKSGDVFSGYKESGYLHEAFINILAFLGWNPGTEQEIFSMDELIQAFSLERIIKAGSRFNPDKAKWFNHQFISATSNEKLAEMFLPELEQKGINTNIEFVAKICGLIKERLNFTLEFWEQSYFFFETPKEYDAKVVKKRWKEQTPALMSEIKNILQSVEDFTSAKTEEAVKAWIEENEYGMGAIMNAFRLCIVGAGKGPHLFDIIEMIGKDETILRLENGIENIKR